jgi:hypothetical protein
LFRSTATPPSLGLKCCRSDGRFALDVIQNTDRRQSSPLSSKSANETAHPIRGDFADRSLGGSARIGCSALHSRRVRSLCPRLPNDHEQYGPRLPHDWPDGRRRLSSELLFAIPPPGFRTSCSAERTSSFGDRFSGCAIFRASRSRPSFHSPVPHRCAGSVSPDLPSQSSLPNLILP